MPTKQINYLEVDGKECCRCGVPFYWMDPWFSWETILGMAAGPPGQELFPVPDAGPLVLRKYGKPLWWKAILKSERKLYRNYSSKTYYVDRAIPDRYGIFCSRCAGREDRWIGVEGRPHTEARQ